jgi:Ca2+/Na+ antiporter
MIPRSPLDDPRNAAFAWARYRRLMRWMMLITLTMVIGAMIMLYRSNGLVSVHFYIATALGISFAMLLMSALMGLVFLSHGTGHDESIVDPLSEDPRRRGDEA